MERTQPLVIMLTGYAFYLAVSTYLLTSTSLSVRAHNVVPPAPVL